MIKGSKHSEESIKKIKLARARQFGPNPFYEKHHSESSKEKLRLANLGKHLSEETKKRISLSLSGENHPMFGKHLSEETKEKLRIVNLGKRSPMLGKHHSELTKKKLRLANLGKVSFRKGISFEQQYGHEKSCKIKNKLRLAQLGKKVSAETKQKHRMIMLNLSNEAKRNISDGMRRSYAAGKRLPPYSMLGKKHSEETKRKMSLSQIGREVTKECREKLRLANLGKKHSPEFIEKISGEKSRFWKGGISFEPYGLEFNEQLKEQIRKRDQYRCQECMHHQNELFQNTTIGMRPCKLSIHHIDFNKKNNATNNLISLCKPCHAQTQFNREDWVEHFNEVLRNGGN